MGVGHVMRSLALAEAAVVAGHTVVVAGHFEGSFLRRQIEGLPVEVSHLSTWMTDDDMRPLIDLVARVRPDVLHVDSYAASAQLRELVASAGFRVTVSNMEDGEFGRRPADVVVDPTYGADRVTRPGDGSTWLARGSRYTPVRRRVIEARRGSDASLAGEGTGNRLGTAARSVLVVMGGTDPVCLVPGAVDLLVRTGLELQVTAIAVGDNADRARVAAQGSAVSLNVLAPVDDLAAVMSTSDLVISAAGTSIWELCCIGVPSALFWVVPNQRAGYERVVAAGAAIGLGGPDLGKNEGALGLLKEALTDSRVRGQLTRAGRQVIDGLGAWRVVRMWEQSRAVGPLPFIGTEGLIARLANLQDARTLWQWRNDPVTRDGSRSTAEVPWDDHLRWFAASLDTPSRMLLVVEDPLGLVGTVRWDLRGQGEWEVSITVSPARRSQSLARPLLRTAETALSDSTLSDGTDVKAYLAVVHIDNQASSRLFETSSYLPDLPPDSRGFIQFRKDARVA
jgi:spore coat polysaccharide biosynthesis predicted glycosyltransferase SpsG